MVDRGYPMVIQSLPLEEGGGFIAAAPDLYGCFGDGDTPEAAITDLLRAIEEWIAETDRLGRKVPLPGFHVEKERARDKAIRNLLKSQEKLIAAQDQRLTEARAELAQVKETLASLSDRDLTDDSSFHLWLDEATALPALAGKKVRTSRLPN